MKRTLSIALLTAVISLFSFQASAWDLNDVLKNLPSSGSKDNDKTGNAISAIAGALGLGGNFKYADMVGTWNYSKPAVTFKSDNLLLKAGGVAASTTVENKLATYYKLAGVQNMKMTFNADSTFTMKLRVGQLNGTVSLSDDGKQVMFTFKVLKAINLGTMEAYISTAGLGKNQMNLTFDVTKLLEILKKAGKLTNATSIKSATALLEQYDGLTAGFTLAKTSTTTK